MYEAMYEAMRLAGFAGWTVHCVTQTAAAAAAVTKTFLCFMTGI